MSLPPPRVLVTGASGFVGRWVMQTLASGLPEGSTLISAGADRQGDEALPPFDIADAESTAAMVQRARPTCVIHLAAISTVDEARQYPSGAWDVNVFGTRNLAEALLRHAPGARLIFASTSEVYGSAFNVIGGPLDEMAPLHPTNMYATTKAAADLLLGCMARDGLNVVRLRAFNHTGPGQTPRFVVPAFVAQIVAIERGEQPPVIRVGNLDTQRDFLDVRDVVEAYRLAVRAEELPEGLILNLASGVPTRIGAMLARLLSSAKVPIRVEQDRTRMRPNDLPLTLGDARAARSVLGWRPNISLEKTLADMLDAERGRSTESRAADPWKSEGSGPSW